MFRGQNFDLSNQTKNFVKSLHYFCAGFYVIFCCFSFKVIAESLKFERFAPSPRGLKQKYKKI